MSGLWFSAFAITHLVGVLNVDETRLMVGAAKISLEMVLKEVVLTKVVLTKVVLPKVATRSLPQPITTQSGHTHPLIAAVTPTLPVIGSGS